MRNEKLGMLTGTLIMRNERFWIIHPSFLINHSSFLHCHTAAGVAGALLSVNRSSTAFQSMFEKKASI